MTGRERISKVKDNQVMASSSPGDCQDRSCGVKIHASRYYIPIFGDIGIVGIEDDILPISHYLAWRRLSMSGPKFWNSATPAKSCQEAMPFQVVCKEARRAACSDAFGPDRKSVV